MSVEWADLGHCTYDLHSNFLPCPYIQRSHHFAKCALPQQRNQIIPLAESTVLLNDVMTVFIVDLIAVLVALLKVSISTFHSLQQLVGEPYIVYSRHHHFLLLPVLLRRRHVLAVFGQVASRSTAGVEFLAVCV